MGKSIQAPAAPNYTQAATDQTAANQRAALASARLSNPNITTPTTRRLVKFNEEGGTPPQPGRQGPEDSNGLPTWINGDPGYPGTITPDITEEFNLATPAGSAAAATQLQQLKNDQQLAELANAGLLRGGGILARTFAPVGAATQGPATVTPGIGMAPISNPALQAAFGGNQYSAPLLGTAGDAGDAGSIGALGSISNYFASGQANTQGLNPLDYAARGVIGNPQLQTGLGGAGGLAYGPAAGQYGLASGGPSGPNLSGTLDQSNVAAMPVSAGMTAEQALNARLEPQLARNRASTETQLVNQGLRPGGEAYNNAIGLLGQQENDQRTQAALQGLNLQMAANQQGFGQAQTLNEVANQAALQRYGAGISGAQLANSAIGQNYGQGIQSAQVQNAAQQQGFGQQLQAGDFGNQAQLASFGMGLQNQSLANQAQSQNYQQAFQNLQAQNQAVGQNYAQNLGAANFQNAAQQQRQQQALALQEQSNAALSQNQQTNLALQSSQNAANAQLFGQQMSQQDFNNQVAQQNYANQLSYANAVNQTQGQTFGQQLSAAQYGQAAQQQALAQQLQARQLPLNEITALMSGQQIQNPQFSPYQGMTTQAGNIQQAVQQQGAWDQNVYNQKVASANATIGAIGGLGGSLAGGWAMGGFRRPPAPPAPGT